MESDKCCFRRCYMLNVPDYTLPKKGMEYMKSKEKKLVFDILMTNTMEVGVQILSDVPKNDTLLYSLFSILNWGHYKLYFFTHNTTRVCCIKITILVCG